MTWRERLRRVVASQSEFDAGEEKVEAERQGTVPVAQCKARQRVCLSGVIRSVTYSPAGQAPELLAELYDGSGSVDLVWLGRREIPGIVPGCRLKVEGMLCRTAAGQPRPAIYNPSYQILPQRAAS
ncbi:OB-fold nucleic acid binding domain-containing protein [Ruania alkalisoli]|uniref:OB-fold nucleic acid binding domain-containing protein n=1 Tax=Ruania alkalisoli TaxID=2779775 RepID=A0A7M1SQN1_9MICO|nr:OB-fold nucleic acid binding domain-containing protein [Ruania alkalisoli]QOR69112.1 OB-fold nucleic acid binding domain-containing protein [Ruania alkalisoli]